MTTINYQNRTRKEIQIAYENDKVSHEPRYSIIKMFEQNIFVLQFFLLCFFVSFSNDFSMLMQVA